MEAESGDHSTDSPSKNELSEVVSNEEQETKASNNAENPVQSATSKDVDGDDSHGNAASLVSPAPAMTSQERSLDLPQPAAPLEQEKNSQNGSFGVSAFGRFTSGLGLRIPSMVSEDGAQSQGSGAMSAQVGGVFESLAKGFVDSSRSAVKAVQVKARHAVSQNKRRYQEGGFDLDMAYITENIIAMGFPAGDMSSGMFGFFEGFYRNHMEEVINFFETYHKGKYKVYNLCSERLYDASRFEGKLASFPFDDHNCPPLHLVTSFCQSAYSWLKEDILNVVVVHCKAGMGRTGLMICCLLLYLKFFPTAEEAIEHFNQKRCVDGKALTLPSQIRYVKYFERLLTYFNGENQPGRRCMLRGFRLHKCPYWVRPAITISNHSGVLFSTKKHPKTKDLLPEDFWIKSAKKGVMVFALPGELGLTEVAGDFKIHFQDRQGDFYCWLNTTMTENRKTLDASDLDGFDKRKLPSPGFQVEVVMVDYDGTLPASSKPNSTSQGSSDPSAVSGYVPPPSDGVATSSNPRKPSENEDDVFSDSDGEQSEASNNKKSHPGFASQIRTITHGTEQMSLVSQEPSQGNAPKEANTCGVSDIKSMAADASVFTFGDEEDFESD